MKSENAKNGNSIVSDNWAKYRQFLDLLLDPLWGQSGYDEGIPICLNE